MPRETVPPSRRLAAAAALAAALAVAACGVRGDPEPPPDADPQDVVEPGARPIPPADGQRPERPFVLDRILM